MKTIKYCNNCKSKIIIEENSLVFESEKKEEEAYCPICKKLIHSGQTDGWFFTGVYSEEKEKADQCIYPMP